MKKSNSNISTCKHKPDSFAERILEYFDVQSGRFRDALNAARSYFSVQGIHDVCLQIEKIRHLYNLVEYTAPSFAQKPDASNIDTLYQRASALQDLDIRQSITLQWLQTLDVSEYFNCLKDNELRLRPSFIDAVAEFPFATISSARPLIHSILAIQSKDHVQRKLLKKLSRLGADLMDVMDIKKASDEDLRRLYRSAESLMYKMEIWNSCLDKSGWTSDLIQQLDKIRNSLGSWNDHVITHQSVIDILKNKNMHDFADSTAYLRFQDELTQQAAHSLRSYKRRQKSLRRALDRLSEANE